MPNRIINLQEAEAKEATATIRGPRSQSLDDPLWRVTWYLKNKWYRRRSRRLAAEVLTTINHEDFDKVFRKHSSYFNHAPYSKYLNARHWLADSAARYYRFGFHRLPPGRKFLDIGCGAGYFLAICRHMKHEIYGLDVTRWAIFNDLIRVLDIPRIEHRIQPGQPLPHFTTRFDVITAFMIGFDVLPDGTPWQEQHWLPFLRNVRKLLNDDGLVIIKFIANPNTCEFYPRGVRKAIAAMTEFHAQFRRDCLRLTAAPQRVVEFSQPGCT